MSRLLPLIFLGAVLLPEIAGAGSLPAYTVTGVSDVQEIVFQSRILQEERRLLIRLPIAHETAADGYPVLLLLDAEWHFTTAAADVELLSECSYVSPHPVPPLIVVGVVNTDRNRDYTPTFCPDQAGMAFPTSGGAAIFRRFLLEEALPIVDDAFRTKSFRILSGWSLAGLFAMDTLLAGGDGFDVYLAISPSLWWDDGLILRQLEEGVPAAIPGGPKRLLVTLGSAEKDRESMVARSVAAFATHVEEHPWPGVSVEQIPIEGMGHNFSPKLAYFYGLATIFSDLTLPKAVSDEGLVAVDAYYADLSRRYRFIIPVPEDVYSTLGWRLFESGDTEAAGTVFQTWVDRHPESAVALASLGSFCRETGDGVRAMGLFRQAIVAEEACERPRHDFIRDLNRDITEVQGHD